MDEFGVLTERYGLKPQGKSAPMAQAKRSTATATASASASTTQSFEFDSGLNGKYASFSSKSSWNSGRNDGSLLDDHDLFSINKGQSSFGLGDNFGFGFGGFESTSKKQPIASKNSSNRSSLDLNSMLFNSGDDIFGGMPSSQNASNDDIFESFASSTSSRKGSSGDLLGDFSSVAAKLKSTASNGSRDSGKNEAGFDDLIPGFGGSSPPVNSTNIKTTKSTFQSTEDPFVVLESATSSSVYNSSETTIDPLEEFSIFTQSGGTKPPDSSNASPSLRPPKPAQVLKADKVKSSGASLIDDLEDFAMGGVRNKASRYKEAEDVTNKTQQNREDDLESIFSVSSRSSSAPKSRAATSDPVFDASRHNRQQKVSAGASSSAKKASSAATTIGIDDWSSIFGAAPVSGEFEEVEGESEERRRARLERHQRTQDRVARAVADMNLRDRQTQHEQDEKRRIAEAMDFEIKRWAAGKEGNMRALLSSLQQVLWPECDWEPVSLTDLITSGSVKKVYRKATLYVHPDKVQQKGATLEQKYIAEKVFDILKEAWNKFNKEELR